MEKHPIPWKNVLNDPLTIVGHHLFKSTSTRRHANTIQQEVSILHFFGEQGEIYETDSEPAIKRYKQLLGIFPELNDPRHWARGIKIRLTLKPKGGKKRKMYDFELIEHRFLEAAEPRRSRVRL